MNKSNKKHLDYEQLITMYSLISRGCGYKEVCAKLNCSRQTLYRIITQHCTIKRFIRRKHEPFKEVCTKRHSVNKLYQRVSIVFSRQIEIRYSSRVIIQDN